LILEAAPTPPQEIIRRRVGRNAHLAVRTSGAPLRSEAELQAAFSRPPADADRC
jgi:hypothetical protein